MTKISPEAELEISKIETVEHAFSEGGIIDRHLNWVPAEESESAGISARDYGYMPVAFTVDIEGMRPKLEPVRFIDIASKVIDEPEEMSYSKFAQAVTEVDFDWYDYLTSNDYVSPEQAAEMQTVAAFAYVLDTLTEDNLPAYTSTIFGRLAAMSERYGLHIPALEEWGRGIWTAEEGAHGLSMNEYGQIMGMTSSPEHHAGRTSQLRAGMDIDPKNITWLMAYVTWQELSTNYAHMRDGQLFGPIGSRLLARIAKDEARHHNAYLGGLKSLLEHFPGDTISVMHEIYMNPVMPGGRGIPNFTRRALKIHGSGIFGVEQAQQAVQTILKKLDLYGESAERLDLTDDEKQKLTELTALYPKDEIEQRKRRGGFVLGQTMEIRALTEARRDYERELGISREQPKVDRM